MLQHYSMEGLRQLFSENLQGLVAEKENKYITRFLMRLIRTKQPVEGNKKGLEEDVISFMNKTSTHLQIISSLFKSGDYVGLTQLGDSYLFITGWFPEWASKKRKASMGISFFISQGMKSYAYAIDLCNHGLAAEPGYAEPGLINKFYDTFTDKVNTILELRKRISMKNPVADKTVYHELVSSTGYRGERPEIKVIPITGWYSLRERTEYSKKENPSDDAEASDSLREGQIALTIEELIEYGRIAASEREEGKRKPNLKIVK